MATTADSVYAPSVERPPLSMLVMAFLASVLIATVWGAIVQTQFNLAALVGLGVDITAGVRIETTLRDIFGGFSLTYGGYVVLPSLLVAFLVCVWLIRYLPGPPLMWFALAGYLAIPIGNAVVNFISPLALLVGATRDIRCTLLMAIGGALAGLVFGWIYLQRGLERARPEDRIARRDPAVSTRRDFVPPRDPAAPREPREPLGPREP
jgi:hypothetical protein